MSAVLKLKIIKVELKALVSKGVSMRLSLVLALIIAVLAVVFALQNPLPVIVNFLPWELRGSLALVLLITLVLGVLVGLLVSLPSIFRKERRLNHQKKIIEELEHRLAGQHPVYPGQPEQPI
jgi:lipopolysaccharide assembly protein A